MKSLDSNLEPGDEYPFIPKTIVKVPNIATKLKQNSLENTPISVDSRVYNFDKNFNQQLLENL